MGESGQINYVEFPAADLEQVKAFYQEAFSWEFADYGPEYTAFSESGLMGGFFKSDLKSRTENGSALVVLYAADLEEMQAKVEKAGARISVEIFSFPGGRRFQFLDPHGNELAVWSDK